MSYRETARAFAQAERLDLTANNRVAAERAAARKLPMSRWAESRRADMTPQTIAHNHALHVSDCAKELREALSEYENAKASDAVSPENAQLLAIRARALLAAIGEEEVGA